MRLFLLALLPLAVAAQPTPDPADVGSLDAIIEAYYEVVSGPAGQARDWARDSTLHHPDALVTVVASGPDGQTVIRPTDLGSYHVGASGLAEAGFFEVEIARRTERHGAVAHVWSTYEWRRTDDGPVGGRGVNSIQLIWDGDRWWIVSWMFDGRSDAPPVPEPYLPQ
ncbi:MAG: nuclear transport factor 2 family protein [Bacteroidota bacterium]